MGCSTSSPKDAKIASFDDPKSDHFHAIQPGECQISSAPQLLSPSEQLFVASLLSFILTSVIYMANK